MKRMKRWNGDLTKLSTIYLENVIDKMVSYGESVQFSVSGTVDGPNYQVINESGKKISFDSNHLLTHTDAIEFTSKNSVAVYSLDEVKSLLIKTTTPAVKVSAPKARRATGATPRGGSALAKAREQIAIQKYEYYKSNRATLPSDIRDHSEEITRMMEGGMSAESAFNEAIKLCFAH